MKRRGENEKRGDDKRVGRGMSDGSDGAQVVLMSRPRKQGGRRGEKGKERGRERRGERERERERGSHGSSAVE